MREMLRLPVVRKYVLGYAITAASAYFALTALTFAVYDLTRSPLAVGVVLLASEIVPALFSPAIVAALDRSPSRASIGIAYVIQAFAYGLLALVVVQGMSGTTLVAVTSIIMMIDGACNMTSRSLLRAGLVIAAREVQMEREINAALNVIMTFSMTAGPILAGVVVGFTSPQFGFMLTAFGLSLGSMVVLSARSLPTRFEEEEGVAQGHLGRAFGLVFGRQPVLGGLLIAQIAAMVFFTSAAPVEVVLVRENFGSSEVYGLLLGIWGAGAALTSLLYARRPNSDLPTMVFLSSAALSVGLLLMAVAPTTGALYASGFVAGMGNGVQWVATMSLLQSAVSDSMQARVVALMESGSSLSPALGFAAGALLATSSPELALLVAGGGGLACSAWLLIASRRVQQLRLAAAT